MTQQTSRRQGSNSGNKRSIWARAAIHTGFGILSGLYFGPVAAGMVEMPRGLPALFILPGGLVLIVAAMYKLPIMGGLLRSAGSAFVSKQSKSRLISLAWHNAAACFLVVALFMLLAGAPASPP